MYQTVRALALLSILLPGGFVFGHTVVDSPNGGETMQVGDNFTIEWHVFIMHNTENWDVWYSTVGPDGPWTVIAEDLPPGDISSGAVHVFDWIVPIEAAGPQVWVRVRQDNEVTDYEDVSDDPFTVVDPGAPEPEFIRGDCNGNGALGLPDATHLLGFMFSNGATPQCQSSCDMDDSGSLGLGDALLVLNFLFGDGPAPASPYPDCGSDPTPGAPGCDTPPTACP